LQPFFDFKRPLGFALREMAVKLLDKYGANREKTTYIFLL